jgi:hypothetical protein
MASSSRTVTLPSSTLTSFIASALRMVDSTIGSLPPDELAIVVTHLQHTNAVTGHIVNRTRSRADPYDEPDIAHQYEELAAFLDALGIYISFYLYTAGSLTL